MKTTITDVLQKHHPIAIKIISECPNCSKSFKLAIKGEAGYQPAPTDDRTTRNGKIEDCSK